MTPRRKRWLLLGGAVAAIGLVVGLVFAGEPILNEPSGAQMIGLRLYDFETVGLFGTAHGSNFTYRGATFRFVVYCAPSPPVPAPNGEICGSVTEPNGARENYSFVEPELPGAIEGWQSWVSPDAVVAVEYHPGGTARLLVTV